MTLSDKLQKCKEWFKESEKDIFVVLIIILTAFISFGLGRLSSLQDKKVPITIENAVSVLNNGGGEDLENSQTLEENSNVALTREAFIKPGELNFVASKNGTKYYFPWCGGVKTIKSENKIWFSSREEAEKAGYAPAKNCKGL